MRSNDKWEPTQLQALAGGEHRKMEARSLKLLLSVPKSSETPVSLLYYTLLSVTFSHPLN